MYRAMTLKVFEHGLDPNDRTKIAQLADATEIRFECETRPPRVILDNRDVSAKIRSREITNAVSAVSSIQEVREVMVREQRKIGKNGGIVVEGRDIGTVVFPDADLKIFMVADLDERARRRQLELADHNMKVDFETLQNEIIRRDDLDSHRTISPLKQANDAITLDTTHTTIDEQVDFIVQKANELINKNRN